MRGTPLNVSFGRATGTIKFRSKSVLLSTSKISFMHCSPSVLDRVTSTQRMAILHRNGGTSMCVPRSVVRHLLNSDIHFTRFHFPCMISDIVIGSPTTVTNVRPNSDVVTLSKGPISCASFLTTVTREERGTGTLRGSDVGPRRVSLACIHSKGASMLALAASSTFGVKMTIGPCASQLLPMVEGRCNFFRSFPTNMTLKIGALGNCMNGVGCLFSGRKTGRLNNFKAVKDVFPTA